MNMKLFWIRVRVAFTILFSPRQHWVLFKISSDDLLKSIVTEEVNAEVTYHRMHEFNVLRIARAIASEYDDTDMVLLKAQFEAEAELFKSK